MNQYQKPCQSEIPREDPFAGILAADRANPATHPVRPGGILVLETGRQGGISEYSAFA